MSFQMFLCLSDAVMMTKHQKCGGNDWLRVYSASHPCSSSWQDFSPSNSYFSTLYLHEPVMVMVRWTEARKLLLMTYFICKIKVKNVKLRLIFESTFIHSYLFSFKDHHLLILFSWLLSNYANHIKLMTIFYTSLCTILI